jgi:DNA-binding XRE family transcriptional regulator
MTPDELRQWRTHMGLSQQAASELLDVRKQTVTDWETGKHAPSKSVALACAALAHGLEPWPVQSVRRTVTQSTETVP